MRLHKSINLLIQSLAVFYSFSTLETVAHAQILKTNCDYLKSIYKEIDLPTNWNDNTNDCCTLAGIECNPYFNIIKIDLDKHTIKGKLSEDIGYLTDLQLLKLSNNQIYGNIPKNVGKLLNLEELTLNNNELSGEIPATIGSLQRLHTLNLGNNGLYNYIPDAIGSLSNLNKLFLENNLFEGAVPTSLSYIKNLEHINLSGNNKLKGKVPTMNSLKTCEYGNTTLCYLTAEKCKSTLLECTPEQINDTDNQLAIQNNKEKLEEEKLEEENKTETNTHNEIYDWLYRPYIFVIIVAVFVILILLLFYVVKIYIKYRYEKELKLTMGQRPYFVNHSLRQKRFNNENISNKVNSDFNNDDSGNGNQFQNNNTLSSGTRNSIGNYRPIYPDNSTTDSQIESGINNGQGPAAFQVPALAYASPQHRSTVTSQLINNGDYLIIDQGSVYDSYNPKRNSLHSINLNNGQLHNTRSRPRTTRPRSHTSGHSPVPNTLTPYNTNRYSYSGMLYTSSNASNRSNRHSLGLYSNVNSVITNHSGNASNYGASEPGSAHDDDNDYTNEMTYSDGKSLNQNLRNDSRISNVPANRSNGDTQADQSKETIPKKKNEEGAAKATTKQGTKNHDDDASSSASSCFVAKLDSSDSELEMPSQGVSQKNEDSGIDGDNDSSYSNAEARKNNNKTIDTKQQDSNEINHSISMVTNNGHVSENLPSSEDNLTPTTPTSPTAPTLNTITPTTSTPSTPTTVASTQNSQPLSKAEIAKRESTYIKNHKRKIPVYIDKSRSIRVNSVVQRNSSSRHRRRHSLQHLQRHLSYSSGKNSFSMNNLVQLNNPNVIPIQNNYVNTSLAHTPSEHYQYDASTSSNIQPRNSIIYRTNDNAPVYSVETTNLSKRAKHHSMVSIGSNGHATFYIGDDVNGTPVYSNSLHLSNSMNPLYIAGNQQSHQIHQHPQINMQDLGHYGNHLEVQSNPNSPTSEGNINRTDSNTNISNLLRLANETGTPSPPPEDVKENRKQSTANSNVEGGSAVGSAVGSAIGVDRMNIIPTNVNVSGVPLTAFNINGVTYVPAGSAAAINSQPMNNPAPAVVNRNSTILSPTLLPMNAQSSPSVVNRNSTILSPTLVPVQVPMVNNNIAYLNSITRSPTSPSHSIQSPVMTAQPLVINTNSPYTYNNNALSPNVSPANSPLIQPAGFGTPNMLTHSSPVSPHLIAQELSSKGEVIHIDGQKPEQGKSQGQGQGQAQEQNSNGHNNSDIGVPEIVLKSATNETTEMSSPVPPSTIPNPSYIGQVSEPVSAHSDPVIYDEVIEVPGTDRRILRRSIYLDNDNDVYKQMIAYDGILSESAAANSAVDPNAQYVAYNYNGDEVNHANDGEVEFYYEEESEDEAPPPYSEPFQ